MLIGLFKPGESYVGDAKRASYYTVSSRPTPADENALTLRYLTVTPSAPIGSFVIFESSIAEESVLLWVCCRWCNTCFDRDRQFCSAQVANRPMLHPVVSSPRTGQSQCNDEKIVVCHQKV